MNTDEHPRRLTNADITAAASLLGVETAVIRAVLEVESSGHGFDSEGSLPIILFEPHVFYKFIASQQDRILAETQGLAYPKWGTRPYPASQSERWEQLRKAIEIDREDALRSTSWGLGQIMGFNFRLAGYSTISDFVVAMHASEGLQLLAMCAFIRSNRLDAALQRKDWRAFARGYNGAGFEKHGYHLKLQRAYARWVMTSEITT